jgi:hypothetical protein
MSNNLASFRRLTVAIALSGITAIGAVALAPAAMADETAVVESAPVVEPAPVVEAPVVESAPVVEAPVVVPPPVVVDKDGNEHKAPKYCTVKDLEKVAKKVAEATKAASVLVRAADKLHASADALRAQAAKSKGFSARLLTGLASAADWAGDLLDEQAQKLIDKASEKKCMDAPVGGGRF